MAPPLLTPLNKNPRTAIAFVKLEGLNVEFIDYGSNIQIKARSETCKTEILYMSEMLHIDKVQRCCTEIKFQVYKI